MKSGKGFKTVEYVLDKGSKKANSLSSLDALLYSYVIFLFLRWLKFGREERGKQGCFERTRCKEREILLPFKARSGWSRFSSWVDRHIKIIRSDIGLRESDVLMWS